ncbi:transketolase C-terminal domain-containing protein [Gracilibacillus sp. YIM 98692]|uniref:transketolase family protein n=1 Tax=Gracilibacillus sp. YIM 98692 TaxID=2663532 RepID=UPI0013D3358C|nr:transketolase C-terminal domain-containing protein [Gracilibacillus sp. YIM 98692]
MHSINTNTIPNRKAVGAKLIQIAKENKDIYVLTSDSRGSTAMAEFGKVLPDQLIEVGIAEQNLIGIASGLAKSGKKPFVSSYACFITMRSIEQIKVDVAYSNSNVKIIGVSGGVSYSTLGMSHHSLQDIAVTRAIPNLDVMIPADRIESEKMIEALVDYDRPVYMRIGRNAVPDVYTDTNYNFELGKAVPLREGDDITIIATGETVSHAIEASDKLKEQGIECRVLNIHTIKPLDEEKVLMAAEETKNIITMEEHSVFGGLGSAVSELLSQHYPTKLKILGFPDEPCITGNKQEIFDYYGLNADSAVKEALQMLATD